MFPNVSIEEISVNYETETVGCDFLFDYETGQHIVKNGVLAECNTIQGIQQFIQNVLRTKANSYKVYTENETEQFGISIYDYIGTRKLPDGYLNSELKREVTETLLKHPFISEVKNWNGKRNKRGLAISFTTVLTDNTLIETSENVGDLSV